MPKQIQAKIEGKPSKIVLRLPEYLLDWYREEAKKLNVSINSMIMEVLEHEHREATRR